MALPDLPAERHRQIGGLFTDRVRGTQHWDAPTPVAGWAARDVVGHLTGWFPAFLSAGAGIELPRGPSVDADPVAAWQVHCDAVQALLDNPATAARVLTNQHIGTLPLDRAIDQFYTADVFMHAWDLARATGQDERLDPGFCAELLAGMKPPWRRSSGPLANTARKSRCQATRARKPGCWDSSAGTPAGFPQDHRETAERGCTLA